jgi:hypothetical protein
VLKFKRKFLRQKVKQDKAVYCGELCVFVCHNLLAAVAGLAVLVAAAAVGGEEVEVGMRSCNVGRFCFTAGYIAQNSHFKQWIL